MGTHPIFESDFDCLTEGKMSDFNLDQLGNPNAMMAGAAALTQDASSYTNTQDVEAVWAARAFQQAEVHMKLLKAVGPARMKFSKMDDEIYDSFRKEFPDFNIKKIDEDLMKEKSNGANGVTNTKKVSKTTISEPCSELTPTRITPKKTRSSVSASNS